MHKTVLTAIGALAVLVAAAVTGYAAESQTTPAEGQKKSAPESRMVVLLLDPATAKTVTVPLISNSDANRPVAVVNNDVIDMSDLRRAVADAHQPPEGEKRDDIEQAKKINFSDLVKRLINVLLIVQEAANIGLDESPEVKRDFENFSKMTMRNLLREDLWKDLVVDEKEVEKAYRASVDEVKITLVPYKKEKDAKKAAAGLKKGKKFDEVVAAAVKKGLTVVSVEGGRFFKMEELHPAIADQIPKMKSGDISSVCKIEKEGKTAFGLFRFEERRVNENPAAREAARQKVLETAKVETVAKYLRTLYKTGVTTNIKLVEGLEYASSDKEIEKLLTDERVVVEIAGDSPVTVGNVIDGLLDKLYHGSKSLNKQKWNRVKQDIIEELVQKKLLYREAVKRGMDKTDDFRKIFGDYRRNVLFNAFMTRVVVPDIKLSEEELQAYYREHAAVYRYSAQVKMRTLGFEKKPDAVTAIEMLKKGGDFGWVRSHAEGQRAKTAERTLPFEEEQFMLFDALPEDMRKSIEVPRVGQYRLYENPEGGFYVLDILEVTPETQQPFTDVRENIRGIVFGVKLNKSIDEWAAKLKASSDVKVYLAGSENR